MAGEPVFLGVDLGTTSVKAQAVTASGVVLNEGRATYGHIDDGVRFDQDPEEIWAAFVATVQRIAATLAGREVGGIGIVGQSPTMLWLDHSGRPLTRAMGWRDVRAAGHVERIAAVMTPGWQKRHLGYDLPITAGFTPTRLSWYVTEHPAMVDGARAVVALKDLAVFRLTGHLTSDPANARGISHAVTKELTHELLETIGLDVGKVPGVRDPWERAGVLQPAVATQLGLPAGTPVAVGWGDLFASMLSTAVLSRADREYDITGTAEAGGASTAGHLPAPGLISLPITADLHATYGSTQAGGGSVAWWQERILLDRGADRLSDAVGERLTAPPSVLFLPHLGGERAPLWNRVLRGTFLGLDASHDRVDMSRAVLEGVAFSVRQLIARIEVARGYPLDSPVMIAGAAAGNTTWNRIKADILGRSVEICALKEPSAFGAAILAMVAADGASNPFDVSEQLLTPGQVIDPDPRHSAHYEELFALYDGAEAALASLHAGLERVRGLPS